MSRFIETSSFLELLQLLDVVSCMESLGFEKSYREVVVLMTRSYLEFLLIAKGITDNKLCSNYRHRLLSLCSDVGLAAESKSGGIGEDFLGPLLPVVAEICSDFEPSTDVEISLLKLFRKLWFYVALLGLAPPIQKSQIPTKTVSSTLNSVGSMSTNALQAVGGPYMWNLLWSSAVQRISLGTPPLIPRTKCQFKLQALCNGLKMSWSLMLYITLAVGEGVEMKKLLGIKEQFFLLL